VLSAGGESGAAQVRGHRTLRDAHLCGFPTEVVLDGELSDGAMIMGSPATSASVALSPTTDLHSASVLAAKPLIRRIWPPAIVAFGLGLTAAWACFLGYGLFYLTRLAL
jgi:hypothetical protein